MRNSQKLENKTRCPSTRGTDKQIVVYPHNGRTVSNQKEQTTVSLNNTDECQNQCGVKKAGQREGGEGGRQRTYCQILENAN